MAHLNNEQKGRLATRIFELWQRVVQGTVLFDPTMIVLQAIIEGRIPTAIPTWRTLTVGGRSLGEFLGEIRAGDREIENFAKDVMLNSGFTVLGKFTSVDLVRVCVWELGFVEKPSTQELFDRSRLSRFGFDLCPHEVGPRLGVVYFDQPKEEQLWVAMEPIETSNKNPSVFFLEHDDRGYQSLGMWLAHSGSLWDLHRELVLIRRKVA